MARNNSDPAVHHDEAVEELVEGADLGAGSGDGGDVLAGVGAASGRVLEKLGFVATGLSAERYSCARNGEAMTRLFRLVLGADEESLAA